MGFEGGVVGFRIVVGEGILEKRKWGRRGRVELGARGCGR